MKICLILVFALIAFALAEYYDTENVKDPDGWQCGTTVDNSGKEVYVSSMYVIRDGLMIFVRKLGCLENKREGTPTGSDFQEGGVGSPTIRWHTCSDPSGICTGEIWEMNQ
ncbi:uncharacterized protein LOC135487136 [Lineus longissimus]|uniref:uncharacterized protein LOC135487136 n=1 Tax=Lineus longissimus TaxID=88925 RepID=UPI002B4D8193